MEFPSNGTTYDSKDFVHVERIDNLSKVLKIQGSRYVKSNMGETVDKIRKDVKERKVLFIGTPCQCSAVKNVIGENENLVLVDLICHGTPSQNYLKQEIKSQKINEIIDDIQFRHNGRYELKIFSEQKVVFSEKWGINYYFNAFMNSLTYQENCYSCKYARKERIGDITIGDFWGIDKEWEQNYSPKTGISLVMVNNSKGMKAFNGCLENVVFYERTLDEAVKGNSQLREPSKKHKSRENFMKDYSRHGYKYAMRKNMFFPILKKRIKYLIDKSMVRKYTFYCWKLSHVLLAN